MILESSGSTTSIYVYGNGINYRKTGNSVYTYTTNAHGDVVNYAEGTTVVKEYCYDAFGNELDEYDSRESENPLRYCGEYYDAETGLYYLRNRYYDPQTGRFITEDTIRDGNNWYVYCNGNPIMFTDSSGLEAVVVSGGKYGSSDPWPYEFIEPALNKIWEWKAANPDETITWLIAMAGWTDDDISAFQAAVHPTEGINVIGFTSSAELQNYINSKDTSQWELSDARTGDKITKFALFSHGTTDSISLGMGFSNSGDLELDNGWIGGIFDEAFNNANSAFYSCNTGTMGNSSFAQIWTNKTRGKTWAFVGTSDYEHIFDGQTLEIIIARFLGDFYWGGSWNLPVAGTSKVSTGPWKGYTPFMKTFSQH